MEEYPLLLSGGRIGTLCVRNTPEGCVCEACCPFRGDGLYRAYLLTEDGQRLLGVMEPEGGCLRAARRFSPRERETFGAVRGGQAVCSFAFDGAAARRGRRIERLLAGRTDVRVEQSGGRTRLLFPYDRTRPFPLPELFCFAAVRRADGADWVVYDFDAEENPQF